MSKAKQSTTKNVLGIVEIDQYRRNRPTLNISSWAVSRGIEVRMLRVDAPKPPSFDGIGLVYAPLCHDIRFLARIPTDIPFLLDYDGSLGGKLNGEELLNGRPFGFRRAFGGGIAYRPDIEIPYLHRPLEADYLRAERDVVIFDVHRWLVVPAQVQFIGLMAQMGLEYSRICQWSGQDIKFYLTSFVSLEPYLEAVAEFTRRNGTPADNPLEKIRENLIPPCEDISDYYRLIGRARLFISDHGDLADQDIVHAGGAGTPILTVPRNPYMVTKGITFSFTDAISLLEPRMKGLIEEAEQRRVRLTKGLHPIISVGRQPPWDNAVLESAFSNSLDVAWKWALTGAVDPRFREEMARAPEWRF